MKNFQNLGSYEISSQKVYLLDTFFSFIFLSTCWLLSNKTKIEQF